MEYIKDCVCEWNKNTFYEAGVFALLVGLLFGPISQGIQFFILSIIIYEILIFYFTHDVPPYYRWQLRIFINIMSLIGWIISRYLHIKKIL